MSFGRLLGCLNKLGLCTARVCRMDCVRDMADTFVVANELRCLLSAQVCQSWSRCLAGSGWVHAEKSSCQECL